MYAHGDSALDASNKLDWLDTMFGDARVDELFLSGLSSLQMQATIGKLGRWVERLDLNWVPYEQYQ